MTALRESACVTALCDSAWRTAHTGITISATREVHHRPARVYAFLARLENHRHLGGRALRVLTLDRDGRGGRIRVATPVGLRRTAHTAITTASNPHRLGGVARVGQSTRAQVHWTIEPAPQGARVVLESTIRRTGLVDRLLLALGGRWWLRRAFGRTLRTLAHALDRQYASEPLATPGQPAAAVV